MYINQIQSIIKVRVTLHSLPLFHFSPIGICFAAGGGVAYFRRLAKPTKCLHLYLLKKTWTCAVTLFPVITLIWQLNNPNSERFFLELVKCIPAHFKYSLHLFFCYFIFFSCWKIVHHIVFKYFRCYTVADISKWSPTNFSLKCILK